ncbi:glycosyltransferase family 39 protein [Streptosporangium sp. 'caverna']|uniref:glycosyltransferase family 39 protein n=1 Tax=Streptosporangium sp. 'caverna' TaxID=2202249 RepID=UPI0013A6C628|nr:glycosyltransferase family 39 protein [Streptosporangium sp. 'caverna']
MTLIARIARSPGALAALAFVFVLWRIGIPSFWRDESVSVMAATMSFDELWKLLDKIDAVHALYYLLLRPFAAFDGELAARLPSALAVAGATFGIVAIGRRVATPQVGMFAGLVYAVLPMVSRYGQEARSYALVSAVAVAATWVLLGERRSRYLGYGLLIALLGWFHLYALLLVPAHAVTILLRKRSEIVPWLASMVGAGVLLVPLALIASGQRDEQLFWLKVPGLADLGTFGVELAGGPKAWDATSLPMLFLGLLLVLALLGTWWALRAGARSRTSAGTGAGTPPGTGPRAGADAVPGRSPSAGVDALPGAGPRTGVEVLPERGPSAGASGPAGTGPGGALLASVTLPWLILPVALSFAISQVYPIYNARYVFFVIPALALLAGAGLAAARRTPVGLAVFTALAVLSASAHLAIREPDARPDDLRTLAAVLSAEQRPGDAVLYVPVKYRLFVAVYGEPYGKLVEPGARSTRVWLVSPRLRGTTWEDDPRLKELKKEFRGGRTRAFGAVRLTLYTRSRISSNA